MTALVFRNPQHAGGGFVFGAPAVVYESETTPSGDVLVFRSPEHPLGGCVFDAPATTQPIIDLPRHRTDTGGKRRKPLKTWRDYVVDEDDFEIMEITTLLLMADIL